MHYGTQRACAISILYVCWWGAETPDPIVIGRQICLKAETPWMIWKLKQHGWFERLDDSWKPKRLAHSKMHMHTYALAPIVYTLYQFYTPCLYTFIPFQLRIILNLTFCSDHLVLWCHLCSRTVMCSTENTLFELSWCKLDLLWQFSFMSSYINRSFVVLIRMMPKQNGHLNQCSNSAIDGYTCKKSG